MRKISTILFLILVAIINTGCAKTSPKINANPQLNNSTPVRGYLRISIENVHPENEKSVIIPFLDNSRKISDRAVHYFLEGNVSGLYDLMAPQYTGNTSQDQFKDTLEGLKNFYGKISSLEYRNQAIEYFDDKSALTDLSKAQSRLWYAVQATGFNKDGLFLTITVSLDGSDCYITSINYIDYSTKIPSWLEYPDAPVKKP
jgi:hypothetical protein